MTTQTEIDRMQAAADHDGFRLVGHHDLGGHGDAMQVIKHGVHVYVAHVGLSPLALSILDCSDPTNPRLVRQLDHLPKTHSHKVQIVGDVMVQNAEIPYFGEVGADPKPTTGLMTYRLDDPTDPRPVGFYPVSGTGVHRIWYQEAPYAHISACVDDTDNKAYHIVDLTKPEEPTRVACWWVPGTMPDDVESWDAGSDGTLVNASGHTVMSMGVHGAIPHGDRAYVSCLDAGFAVLDISDLNQPKPLGQVNWHPPYGGFLHTSLPLPGRGLVVAACEALSTNKAVREDKRIWVIDVRNEPQPVVSSSFPEPVPPAGSPWETYWDRPLNYGPHNLHQNGPGSYYSESLIFSTWNNAGLRVYDISDPDRPTETAHWVPEPPEGQAAPRANDLYVDTAGLVYMTDRGNGGLYILEYAG